MAEDATLSDREYDPADGEDARDAKPWINLLADAEKKFREWQEKCDNIDQLYADLERQSNVARDRQFAMFWANIQVLAPSVYARPPVPVVVPEFKDRDPIKRATSEMLERALKKTFSIENIDSKMRLVRDDMLIDGRGTPWVRFETKADVRKDKGTMHRGERVCIEFIDRKDFRHDPARNWDEVGWVARRGWLTRKEVKARNFKNLTEDTYLDLPYVVAKDSGRDSGPKEGTSPQEKVGIWEIWHRRLNKVVWVVEDHDEVLEEGEPHLELEGFFPCPKPAYSTVQRRTLIPVPDITYYRDQLEEINKLTNRIHALSDAIQVKGFYPGGGEIGDAVEAALNINDDRKVMIPVSNFAAFGGAGGDPIVWLPIDMIATTIAGLIEMRRQIIDDVYQIVGLSDIMRGATEKDETATAQQLKSQYGSIRIRDKQHELVRVAKDLTVITAEIMAENYSTDTLLTLSQMELPKRADIARQVKEIEASIAEQAGQLKALIESPEAQQKLEEDPEGAQQELQQLQQQAQQALEGAQAQIEELQAQATVEDVTELLRDQRIRPFALDIETDSTIQPDEDAEKQRRAEFLQVFGSTMQQLAALVEAKPEAAEFAGEILKFALAPYRVGRELDGAIDKFVEQVQQSAGDKPESPEQIKAKAEAERMQAEQQMRQQETEAKMQIEQMKIAADQQAREEQAALDMQSAEMEAQRKDRELQAKMTADAAKHQQEMQKGQLELQKLQMEMQALGAKIEAQRQEATIRAQSAQQEAAFRERDAQRTERMAEHEMERDDLMAERADAREGEAMERTAQLAERTAAARAQGVGNGAARD